MRLLMKYKSPAEIIRTIEYFREEESTVKSGSRFDGLVCTQVHPHSFGTKGMRIPQ